MFQPYHPDQEVTIGDLTVQSSEDAITLSGQATWLRDQHSLRHLRALIGTLQVIEAHLTNTGNLPETMSSHPAINTGPEVSNPF